MLTFLASALVVASSDKWAPPPPLAPSCEGIKRVHVRDVSKGGAFASQFLGKTPVVIFGHKPVKRVRRYFERGALLDAAGHAQVQTGMAEEIVNSHGSGPTPMLLREFIEQHLRAPTESDVPPHYLFDRGKFFSEQPGAQLNERLPFPSGLLRHRKKGEKPPEMLGYYLAASMDPQDQNIEYFLLGGNGSSVGFHMHADSLVAVLFGAKQWWLYPPETLPTPWWRGQYGMASWAGNLPGAGPDDTVQQPLKCLQRSGELMYIPEGWHHATLNFGDTLAVAQQSRVAADRYLQMHILGSRLHDGGKYKEAERVWAAALKEFPSRAHPHTAMADLLKNMLDPPPGRTMEKLLAKGVDLRGGLPPAPTVTAKQKQEMNRRLIFHLKKAAAMDAGDNMAITALCDILEYEVAESYCDKAVQVRWLTHILLSYTAHGKFM